jgi:uncharacterized protein (TIGR03437 family)
LISGESTQLLRSRRIVMRLLMSSVLLGFALFQSLPNLKAQTPVISGVVNDVTGDTRLSPGLRARVYYSPVLAVDALNTSGKPTVFIYVGNQPGFVIAVAGGPAAAVVLPMNVPLGPTTLTLTTSGGTSAPFNITLDPYSPGLYNPDPYCASSKSDVLHLLAVGLGVTNPLVPITASAPPGGADTVGRPTVTVGGLGATLVKSVLLPSPSPTPNGSPDYDVEVALDPATPEGLQPVTLSIGGVASNTVTLLNGPKTLQSTGGPLSQAAAESIASFYGCSVPLATGTFTADGTNPPLQLGGAIVKVKDVNGVERPAQIYFVSPSQVNYVVPQGTASGAGIVTVTSANGAVSNAQLNVTALEPALFSTFIVDQTYDPLAAAVVVRVRDGVQTVEPTARINASGQLEAVPIDLGPDTDQVFLELFGTGWRSRNPLGEVQVVFWNYQVNYVVAADYAGPQGQFPGLDQINVRVPRGLAGQVFAEISVLVDGTGARTAVLAFQ